MKASTINAFTFDRACVNLTRFAHSEAHRIAKYIGFGYVAADKAPESGRAITAEFEACQREARAFRVYSGGCDSTIYGAPSANHAFRFWHDYYHWIMRATTGLADEILIAQQHAKRARETFGADSLEAIVQLVDVEEQARFFSVTGEFVQDQKAFVFACVTRDVAALALLSADFAADFASRH